MLKVFYGANRVAAEQEIMRCLGEDYEVFEGENLAVTDLPSIFQGTSLFGSEGRKILLKDVSENPAIWEKLVDYIETDFDVIVWEMKLDKRSAGYKRLKESKVAMTEFAELKKPELNLVFNILDTALSGNGIKAVQMVEQIELTQDPYMFFGLMVTQALKKLGNARVSKREIRLLNELSALDMQMKSATIEPWILVKSFLLRIGE